MSQQVRNLKPGSSSTPDSAELFPTVVDKVLPMQTVQKHMSTSPQIDLDSMDFFAAPSTSAAKATPDPLPASKSESSFSSSILSRSHLKQLSEPPATGDALKLKKPRLVVLRGERIDVQYTLYPGKNFMGRTDDKPVDIDLENQEPADRIWTSRQHAVIHFENGQILLEDLNSLNGTFVNRSRLAPHEPRLLQENDVIQVGTVQLKLILA